MQNVLFTPQTSDYLQDVCSPTYIFAKWMWRVPSNSCTYQDKVLCSLTRRRRCTSSWWTFRSTILKIGAPSGDLLDVAQQSLTLKTRHTHSNGYPSPVFSKGPALELATSVLTRAVRSHSKILLSFHLNRKVSKAKRRRKKKGNMTSSSKQKSSKGKNKTRT